jgi:hypothetical protein
MRASGATGAADPPDEIALAQPAADAHAGREAVQMGVDGGDRTPVVDLQIATIRAGALDRDHHAIACGAHRRAARRRPVDAAMHLLTLEDGVVTGAVARGQSSAVDGFEQKRIGHQRRRPGCGDRLARTPHAACVQNQKTAERAHHPDIRKTLILSDKILQSSTAGGDAICHCRHSPLFSS